MLLERFENLTHQQRHTCMGSPVELQRRFRGTHCPFLQSRRVSQVCMGHWTRKMNAEQSLGISTCCHVSKGAVLPKLNFSLSLEVFCSITLRFYSHYRECGELQTHPLVSSCRTHHRRTIKNECYRTLGISMRGLRVQKERCEKRFFFFRQVCSFCLCCATFLMRRKKQMNYKHCKIWIG